MRSFFNSSFFPLGLFVLFFLLPTQTWAADLSIAPDSGSYSVGKTFPVNVYVSSNESINAVSGTLTFPTDKLQVVSVSKTTSILTLWVADPTFSNGAGLVSFEGVVPNPGYIGSSGRIVTINFKVINTGTASVKWNSGSVLANDGSGTNVLGNLEPATFSLGASVPAEETTTDTASQNGLKINSPTYPNSRKWYKENNGNFTWELPNGATAVRILVGKLSNGTPTVVYDPPIKNKQVSDISDGVWYFSLQAKSGTNWGQIDRYMFRVDSTPPDKFTIKTASSNSPTDPKPKFIFTATDSTSGIDHYTIETDGGSPIIWNDNASGTYSADALTPGKHTILAKAYDGAGNSTPASIDFNIDAIEAPVITTFIDKVSVDKPLIINGTAIPNATIKISLKKSANIGNLFSSVFAETNAYEQSTKSDDNGLWSMAIDTSNFESGAYSMTAVAINSSGAQSYPTASKTVLINSSWWQSIGSSIIKLLAIAIPLLALLYVLIVIFVRGFHKVRITNNKFLKEIHGIERLVDRAFVLLKEDVEDSIKLLERTKNKRKLTEEEDAIVKRLRQNLEDAEKIIHKQVEQVEKEVEE